MYTNNVGNQRVSVTRSGENTAVFTYDSIGQVIADQATEVSGGTARANEQLHYAFDPAGNLTYRTNNTLVENFAVNSVNELTANTNGGKLTVMGTTTAQNSDTVTVNGTSGHVYGDATFAVTNLSLTTSYTAIAADSYGRHATNTVTVNMATNNAAFQYDGNGNLISDGLRSFAYDDENQLSQVLMTNQWLSQFAYDGKMRRRIRQEYTWQGGAWVQTNAVYYVYDGNVVVQERNINNLPATTYTRGKDLSGSLEGAGGIGGLLSMTLNTQPGPSSSNSMYYHSDGNGNVTALINGPQSLVAKYLYDAFGNVLSAAGSMAQQNLYRFSSKEAHLNSGLVYYLYRYYEPNLQRWPNRDPMGEKGGVNLYAFVVNEPTMFMDRWGLASHGDGWGGYPGPSRGNCWRYACGNPTKPTMPTDPPPAQRNHQLTPPGWNPSCQDPCSSLMNGIQSSGGVYPSNPGECPDGYHMISVQYSPNYNAQGPDFHFGRQWPDGQWWEKHGYMPPNPSPAPPTPAPGYQYCGMICVPNGFNPPPPN